MVSQTSKRIKNKRLLNPTVRLKVPAGLMAKAVHDKKKTPIIYYYAAKSFRSNGLFKRGELVSHLIEKTGKSKPAVKNNVAKLIKMGWVIKTPKGLQLASYDLVWQELGFDTAADHLGLMYVSPEHDFELSACVKELALNQKKQAKAIEKEIICKTFSISRTELRLSGKADLTRKRKAALRDANILEVKKAEFQDLRALEKLYAETDNSVSCQKFANLFGRTSARTGYRMQQKLKQSGMVSIENRKVNLKTTMTKEQFRMAETNSSFWLYNNTVWKQLPNRIVIL